LAIERRLSQMPLASAPLGASAENAIAAVALEHCHDESFGAERSLFSKEARVTQILIGLNVLMFAAEIYFGGATNPVALYRLGALFAPAVGRRMVALDRIVVSAPWSDAPRPDMFALCYWDRLPSPSSAFADFCLFIC